MTIKLREYSTEGQRLLVEHDLQPADIAARTGVARQRITEWRKGTNRPGPDARRALEAAGIPSSAWDRPPVSAPIDPESSKPRPPPSAPTVRTPTPLAFIELEEPAPVKALPRVSQPPPDPSALEGTPMAELEADGAEGLEGVIARLRHFSKGLPARERIQAIAAEGRLHQALANLQAKERDARREYLEGPEFREDVKLLAAAVPVTSTELRGAMSRLGVELPPLPTVTSKTNRPPPSSAADVEKLLLDLGVAASWREAGEEHLAAGHVLSLCLDVHAEAIAAVLAEAPDLAGRFLVALGSADERVISSSLERRLSFAEVAKLPASSRSAVAQLLEALGHPVVARELGGVR